MASITITIFLAFLFIVSIDGEKKKRIDKIIIHVPYKILKHHHTHTKYKVITQPTPHKENTIIYYKQQVPSNVEVRFPEFQHHPKLEFNKQPEVFIPPHQLSATAQIVSSDKPEFKDQPHVESQHFPQIVHDEKQVELHLSGALHEGFTPSFPYKTELNIQSHVEPQHFQQIVHDQKPIKLHSNEVLHGGFTPSFSYKPIISLPHENFNPMIPVKSTIPYDKFIQKFLYKPMVPPHEIFNSKFLLKPTMLNAHQIHSFPFQPLIPAHKVPVLHDSVAHTSSHVYKTSTSTKPYKNTYKVKEPSQEDTKPPPYQPFTNRLLKNPKMPLLKPNTIQKLLPVNDNQYKTIKESMLESNEPEYEHVGYLIIDGNSRKVVGKDLKSELRMWR